MIIINHPLVLVEDKQRQAWDENKYSLYSAVVKEELWTKQARAMSGCNLFSCCARVHAVLCLLHVELSFVGVLRSCVGADAFSLLTKKHTCHPADVQCGRSNHPSPDLVSVLCTCATTAGGFVEGMIWPQEAERRKKRPGWRVLISFVVKSLWIYWHYWHYWHTAGP